MHLKTKTLNLQTELSTKQVNNCKAIRIILSLLLTVVLINPYIAKDIHILQSEYHEDTCHHSDNSCTSHNHDCRSCQICQFTLSFFTEGDPISIQSASDSYCVEITSIYNENDHTPTLDLNHLRGPPCV